MANHEFSGDISLRKRKRSSATATSTNNRNGASTTKRLKSIKELSEQPLPNETGRIYLNWPDGLEVENPERYRPGGLHPIHIGDFIDKDERFQVLHKLGHGGDSTVWLCYDSQNCLLRAVKILSADASTEKSSELRVSEIFLNTPREELDENHIALPLEHFWVDGPNGRHLCAVSEFLAAKACVPPPGVGQHTESELNEICFQICQGIQYLHAHDVCHGDIRKENFAMELDFRGAEIDDIICHLEEPVTFELQTTSGKSPQPWGPKYLVSQPSLRALESRFGTGHLMIMDFGLSYDSSKPPKKPNFYRTNAAPELLLHMGSKGKSTDIWALGSVLCQIIHGRWIFNETDDYPYFLRQLESMFGPFPPYFKRGVHTLLRGSEDRRRRIKPPPIEHRASITRSGRTYQSNVPMTLGYNMEGYKQEMQDFEKRTGWSKRIQGFLSYRQQFYRYWDRIKGAQDEQNNDESESETGSDGSNASRYEHSTVSQQDTRMRSRSLSQSTRKNDGMPLSKRQINCDFGTWPDPEWPCTCYQRGEDGYLYSSSTICNANDHYIYNPEQTTMFALTKEEVVSFSDLLLKIFRYDPKERLTIDDIINHEWFDEVKELGDEESYGSESQEESESSPEAY
ncbi:kinase-like domain-containing protein [Camillea tinctor]|nr:kinase-like domain-containing protein [Camillea tinctor]